MVCGRRGCCPAVVAGHLLVEPLGCCWGLPLARGLFALERFSMSYGMAIAVLMFAYAAGYVAGYWSRLASDVLYAA
jgi:hypothetical protein